MTKQKVLDAIEHTKKVHLEQMHTIDSLLKGYKVENPTPLSKQECGCGKWFYRNEDEMKTILGAQLFEKIDFAHEEWHKEYASIYNIFYNRQKKVGFFAKLLKNDQVDSLELDKAKMYYVDLKKKTDELLKVAESALRRISALSESKFQADE
jgi:hypothetical protein